MAFKLIVMFSILYTLQVQGFFIKTVGPLGSLQSQILQSKFALIISTTTTRREFKILQTTILDNLELAKNKFDEQLFNLTSRVQELSKTTSQNTTNCLTDFGTRESEIQAIIEEFGTYSPEPEFLTINNDLATLSRMIGSSSSALKTCKLQFPSMIMQLSDLKECITNQMETQQMEIDGIQAKVKSELENIETKSNEQLENATNLINAAIQSVEQEFNTCISGLSQV